jgi:amidase
MGGAGRWWSIRRLGDAYRSGATRPTAAVAALLDRIATEDHSFHAYAHVAADLAMAQAEQAERELAAGLDRGPLHGIPIGVKDLCATRDMPTRAGMPRLGPLMAGEEATVVARLRQAGAVISGKLEMTEGATGNHHPNVVPPVNPWGADLWPGISSSGSGVAVAAGLCQAALGSDTGGSIRFPSSCCGLTGLKPTWGLVSLAGVYPLAYSMDHVGPMARSAEDAALLLEAIAGPDEADPGVHLDAPPAYAARLTEGLSGVAVGVDEALISQDVDPQVSGAVLAAARVLADLGATLTPVSFPDLTEAAATTSGFSAEIALAHAENYPSRAECYGPDLAAILEHAQSVDGREVVRAQRTRQALRRKLDRQLAETPLLILPVLPFPTPTAAEGWAMMRDPARLGRATRFTVIFDLTGHPTITLPCGFDDRGAPIGLQLVGRALSEPRLLSAAHAFQQATDFHTRRPPA